MSEKVETLELLSAFVCGDITPAERTAVEQLLASDPQARADVDTLRALVVTLAKGRKPLRAELLSALKERVEEQTKQQSVEALVSASLTNDLNSRERELLEKHLNSSPSARAEQNSLRELSVHLNRGQLVASNALSAKLAERLNAKLPAAARVGQTAAPAAPKTQSDRPSLRVYAPEENPWRRIVLASTAIAALVALGFGVAQLFGTPAKPGISKGGPKDSDGPEKIAINPETPKHVPPENQPEIPVPAPKIVGTDPKIPNINPENLPPNKPTPPEVTEGPKNPLDPKVPKNSDPRTPAPNDPKEFVKQDPKNPSTNPNVDPHQNVPGPKDPNFVDNNQKPIPPPKLEGPSIGPGPTPNTVATNDPQKNVTPEIKPNPNDAIVSVVRDGNATFKYGDKTQTLTKGKPLPSGSTVITDVSRVALNLPGGAKLYINRGSNVTINTLDGNDVVVNSGEVSYLGGKTATISDKSVSIRRASQVNVKVEANAVVASVMEGDSEVSSKGKSKAAKKGTKTIAKGDTIETAVLTGQPDPWRNDLEEAQKTVTEEKDANNKIRRKK